MSLDQLRSQSRLAVIVAVASLLPAASYAQARTPTARTAVRDYAAELACGASVAASRPAATLRIAVGREQDKQLFGPGDPIIITGGASQGLKVGQEYFVRRIVPDRFTELRSDGVASLSIHTAGWIRITDVSTDSAIATVSHVCDAMEVGDYLEPLVLPPVPASAAAGAPDFANPGRLILGDDRRQMGAPGTMMVLDRGSDHGIRPGQHVTFFRAAASVGGPVLKLGDGTAMIVSPETTIVRIDKSTEAISVGDLVAIHR